MTFENSARGSSEITVTKYQEELDTLEVTGRRAAEVIKAVLRPVNGANKEVKAVSPFTTSFLLFVILRTE